jgi:predicted nucleotidyltransferase component of viral defense system
MKLPIIKKLRKRQHVQIAQLQDIVVDVIYKIVEHPVLHGGTAIWRCYAGNRFSEDLDFYFKPHKEFKTQLDDALGSYGLTVTKYKDTSNVMFCKIINNESEIRLESNVIDTKDSIIQDYEKLDGSPVTVLTLPAIVLIKEKMAAYLNRRFIRDLYDIYHLSSMIVPGEIQHEAEHFLNAMKPPEDEQILKVLLISGAVPTSEGMIKTIRTRFLS